MTAKTKRPKLTEKEQVEEWMKLAMRIPKPSVMYLKK